MSRNVRMALPDTQTAAVGQKEGKYYNCGRPKKKKQNKKCTKVCEGTTTFS